MDIKKIKVELVLDEDNLYEIGFMFYFFLKMKVNEMIEKRKESEFETDVQGFKFLYEDELENMKLFYNLTGSNGQEKENELINALKNKEKID